MRTAELQRISYGLRLSYRERALDIGLAIAADVADGSFASVSAGRHVLLCPNDPTFLTMIAFSELGQLRT